MRCVPFPAADGAPLERANERERQGDGNGEQQYEEADRPQENGRFPSMGAAVGVSGRSLSAWSRTSAEGREARMPRMGQ